MKGLVFATAFLAFLLTCQGGAAKTLEEVLKEKGVITEADYKEVTAARPVTYQAGKGFTFTSPDGKFQLSLGGRGQFYYQYLDRDDVNGAAREVSIYRVRRFKAYMSGYAYTKNLTYRVQVDLAKSTQILDDGWINYRFFDEAQLQAGYFLIPKRLEAAARYSCVDPDRGKDRDRQIDVAGAVSWYFQGHNLKIQGDYTNIHTQIAGLQATDDKQVRGQAQLAF